VEGDAAVLPWPDERFSVVTCIGSFETFPDPPAVLAEIFRVLRPGGRAVLNMAERVPPDTETHKMLGRFWVWAEADVQAMVEAVGFTDVTLTYLDYSTDSRLSKVITGPDLLVVQATKP
jgi:ubiquinone/menaquinone biosynthesis C-methylase UbiE